MFKRKLYKFYILYLQCSNENEYLTQIRNQKIGKIENQKKKKLENEDVEMNI